MTIVITRVATCNSSGCKKSLSVTGAKSTNMDLLKLVKKTEGWQWVSSPKQLCPDHAQHKAVKVKAAKPAKSGKNKKATASKANKVARPFKRVGVLDYSKPKAEAAATES